MGQMFVAERNIKAGEELFANYGEDWLDNRKGSDSDFIPRRADFEKAGNIMMQFFRELNSDGDKGTGGDSNGYCVILYRIF